MTRLTLNRGEWYGWTMWPGYFDTAYFSPIQVWGVIPHGNRSFNLKFLNLGYAEGVQDMNYSLKTLRREGRYILAAVVDSDRSVAIEPMTAEWFRSHLHEISQTIARENGKTSLNDGDLAQWLQRYSATADRF